MRFKSEHFPALERLHPTTLNVFPHGNPVKLRDHTHETKRRGASYCAFNYTDTLPSTCELIWAVKEGTNVSGSTPFQASSTSVNAFSGYQYLLVEIMNQVQSFVYSRTPLLTPLCLSPLTQQHICSSKYTQAHLGREGKIARGLGSRTS